MGDDDSRPAGGQSRSSSPVQSAGGDTGYATSTFWASQSPGARTTTESQTDPAAARFLSAVRELGPWVLVHVAFLSVAAGTGLYFVVVGDWQLSLPLLLVLVGELGVTVVLSSIHVATRLAR
jgi:hypothetical protein